MAFFYHQRSGVEITHAVRGRAALRAARRPPERPLRCGCSSGCDYELDASGGWYDAGDHGKYVVNGGISVLTLLNLYERSVAVKADAAVRGRQAATARGRQRRARSARRGALASSSSCSRCRCRRAPLAGMVAPQAARHEVDRARHRARRTTTPSAFLLPPSTAATLNLAAVAAQARAPVAHDRSRVQQALPRGEPSARSMRRSRTRASTRRPRAARAAVRTATTTCATSSTGPPPSCSSRPARRSTAQSARAFAARIACRPRPAPRADAGEPTLLTWQTRRGRRHAQPRARAARASAGARTARARAIVSAGRSVPRRCAARQGYGLPLRAGRRRQVPLGLELVRAQQRDRARAGPRLHAASASTATASWPRWTTCSAATRSISRTSPATARGRCEHPHHRFFAQQVRSDRPAAAAGPGLGRPQQRRPGSVCARPRASPASPPQKCFIDHIEAWSTNEVTINWNAPLAWVAAFLAPLESEGRRATTRGRLAGPTCPWRRASLSSSPSFPSR